MLQCVKYIVIFTVCVFMACVRCNTAVKPIWPLDTTVITTPTFSCDVCQMLTDTTSSAMNAYKSKKGLARKGMLDVAIMEVANTEHLCTFSYWYNFSEKIPNYSVYSLIDECKKIIEKNEEEYENILSSHYENATKMAEKFCIPQFCTDLWKDGEFPDQREKQIDRNMRYAKEFAAWNLQNADVQKTESGLQYTVVKGGNEGPKPTNESKVTVHYEGKLLSGVTFDSSYKRNKPAIFDITGVIPGWSEGLKMMSVGDQYKFYIPPELGYGSTGAGSSIGPNEFLVFDVELIEIVDPTKKDEL